MRRTIGITGLIVVAMMLAMVPSVTAYAVDTAGQIDYENGTPCDSLSWITSTDNLNRSYVEEPNWGEAYGDQGYIIWDYLITARAETDDDYLLVTVTSLDGKWYGESTVQLKDVWDDTWVHYVVDLVVYEVPQETETFTKSLPAGWNLISLPLTPTDNSVGVVLNGVSQDAVKSYNAATHQFEDATTMDPGVGYFIHMTAADTWSYEGTAYTSMTATLSQGLNMVGWTNTSAALPGALSSIDGSYRYVARWNAGTQSYEVYLSGAPAAFNDFATMDRGEGYFIAATAGCTLTYP
jgi:hypothetical protein